uniref:Ig-like domain-containing protein n=1 Tax=Pygocentrus nattereri TaxID=42514 RepID=A0A3B4DTT1_PYGNA
MSFKNWATVNEDIISLERLKFIHLGDKINLTCSFSSTDASAAAWFKETRGEKPLLFATAFRSTPVAFHNGFNKNGRYRAIRERSSFILNILDAEPSDSATYYCAVVDYSNLGLGACTVLVLKGRFSVLQPPVSDPVELGGDTTLQCSILTDASAGDHSVYWFRHGSGESHPGIIYTHGNRSDECKKSSETDSPTQSCVYKLPKRNLSLSDAGTYYCAVLMCGEIIFGSGTKLDFEAKKNIHFCIIIIITIITTIIIIIIIIIHPSIHPSIIFRFSGVRVAGTAS